MNLNTGFKFDFKTDRIESLSEVLIGTKKETLEKVNFAYVSRFHPSKEEDDYDDVILVNKDDDVFCIGTNKNGCLGLGHNERVYCLTKNDFLSQKKIKIIESTNQMMLCLSSDGQVYGWGINEEVVTRNEVEDFLTPKLLTVPSKKRVIDIKQSYCRPCCLTDDGEVYVWHKIDYHKIENIPEKMTFPCTDNVKVKSIHYCYAIFAVLDDGRVYRWQEDPLHLFEQNDHGYMDLVIDFKFFKKIKRISFNPLYLLILAEDGCLFWCSHTNCNDIRKISVQDKIMDILSPPMTSFFLTENGHVYVCGQTKSQMIWKPQKISENLFAIIKGLSYIKITFKWTSKDDGKDKKDDALKKLKEKKKTQTIKESNDDKIKKIQKDGKRDANDEDDGSSSPKLFFDLTLIADNQRIKCNKKFLSLISRKFSEMFKKDQKLNEFKLEGIKFKVLQSMINYNYGQPFEPEYADKLLIAAHEYELKDLHKAAETELIKQLKRENAFKLAFLGKNYDSDKLKNASLNFIFSVENCMEMKNHFEKHFFSE